MYTYNEDGELLENGMWVDYDDVADILNNLEAKLAESEKELQENKIGCFNTQEALFKKIKKLEQQLAEKEEEIKDLNYRLDLKFVNYTNSESIKFLEDQDKISFCIEQLKIAQKYIQQYVNNFDDMNDCLYEIDNQIKQLKEMK
jgi:6-pyruvoyl-tetrahydropterin synthase